MNGHFAGVGKDATREQYEHGVQVIDSDKNYNPNLPTYLSLEKITPVGFNYHLISVFGSQSTGKSTLLNYLFGTEFGVMSEDDRRQTTKGIWLSKNKKENAQGGAKSMAENILVMDVEGTDGRERGEDQDFERKSALFALATSEVLIVNIWEHQVGLYQGANMALLKTVFEVNLELFLKDRKSVERSLLFFVIRDHIGTTPLANLRKTLQQDLSKIWESLSKPKGMESARIEDYFDLMFVALPHKILQPEKFEQEVAKLGTRFREGRKNPGQGALRDNDSDGVFLPEYHRRIPADGFSHYAEGVWDQIVNNKDLDLPTQQELLAQFRCDEIAREAFVAFDEVISPLEKTQQESIRSGKPSLLPELGGALNTSRSKIMTDFDEEASRYHKGVYQRKREELETNVDARLKALLVGQLDAAHKSGIELFSDAVSEQVRQAQKKGANYDFAVIVATEKKKALGAFERHGKELLIEGATWSDFRPYLARYQKDLDVVSARLRKDEMRRLATRVERMVRTRLNEKVGLEFNSIGSGRGGSGAPAEGDKPPSEKDLWDRIWKVFTESVQYAEGRFVDRAKGLDASPEEIEVGLWRLRRKSWNTLKAKIEEEVMEGNILMKLRENFEDRFRYDADGVPRIWRPTDDIEGIYTKARDETLTLIPLLSHFRLHSTSELPHLDEWIGATPASATAADEEDLQAIGGVDPDDGNTMEDEMTVLSDSKASDLTARFKKTADGVYVEAKRSAIGGITQVPVWFYGLLLLLGWNELMALLRNPLYFIFLAILAGGAYVTYNLNLWGPMIRMADAATKQAIDIAKERLRDFLESQEGAQGSRGAMSTASSSKDYEMRSQRRSRRKPEADEAEEADGDI